MFGLGSRHIESPSGHTTLAHEGATKEELQTSVLPAYKEWFAGLLARDREEAGSGMSVKHLQLLLRALLVALPSDALEALQVSSRATRTHSEQGLTSSGFLAAHRGRYNILPITEVTELLLEA